MKCLMSYGLIILIGINGIMLNLLLIVFLEHNRDLILVLVILLLYLKKLKLLLIIKLLLGNIWLFMVVIHFIVNMLVLICGYMKFHMDHRDFILIVIILIIQGLLFGKEEINGVEFILLLIYHLVQESIIQ